MHSRIRSSKYSCSHSQQPLLSGTRGRAAQGKERDTFTRKSPAPPFQVIEYCDVYNERVVATVPTKFATMGEMKRSKTRLCKTLIERAGSLTEPARAKGYRWNTIATTRCSDTGKERWGSKTADG